MKKSILIAFFVLVGSSLFAQQTGDLVIFSNDGYQFYVMLNGVNQNTKAETNVKIQGLTNEYYGCRITAYDNSFSVEKNIITKKDTLITYQLLNKNGKIKLRFYSETPLRSTSVDPAQTVIVYHATETVPEPVTTSETTTVTTTTTTSSASSNVGSEQVSTQTQAEGNVGGMTMNTGMNTPEESVNISFSASENGFNVNMSVEGEENFNSNTSVNATGLGTQTSYGESTYSETTTVTTTTTTMGGTSQVTSTMEETEATPIHTTSSWTDCEIDQVAFNRVKNQIEEEAFADGKLRVANRLASSKCLTVQQIKEISELFSFSDDQLSFMKAAHPNCQNKEDYYELMGVFTFSSDQEALESFLNKQ